MSQSKTTVSDRVWVRWGAQGREGHQRRSSAKEQRTQPSEIISGFHLSKTLSLTWCDTKILLHKILEFHESRNL